MNSPHNYFRIGAATIYAGDAAGQEQEDGSKRPFDCSCPVPGAVMTVRPAAGSALGTISAWVKYSQPPVAVRALIYPHEHFGSLTPRTGFNPNSVLADRNGEVFSWTRIPGANYSHCGNINDLVVWVQQTPDSPWLFSGHVTFTGVLKGGAICASGPERPESGPWPASGFDSGFASGVMCGSFSGPRMWLSSGPGSGLSDQVIGGVESTFAAAWRLEISGLEGPYATLNYVYIVRRAHSGSTWENGGDAKAHCRVTMNHSAESRCWSLMALRNGISLTAEAPAQFPFGPLHFVVHGAPATCGHPHIVATPVVS